MLVRLKASLNGDRERSEHPAVPITPTELATAARAAIDAGADALHLHPRDDDGAESLMADDVAAAVSAVRKLCPGVLVGVSTGLWMAGGDADRRLLWINDWARLSDSDRPDFASVNVSESGAGALAGALLENGIGVEAGVWSTGDVETLAGLGPVPWTRILVELGLSVGGPGVPPEQVTDEADRILDALQRSGTTAPVLLHGEQSACWPCIRHAGRRHLPTRIGLEDVLTGPGGEPVADNAALVRLALREYAS